MSQTTKHFELNFKNSEAKAKKIALSTAKETITPDDAKAALEAFVNTDIFNDGTGDKFASAVGARYVTRTVDDIYLVTQD